MSNVDSARIYNVFIGSSNLKMLQTRIEKLSDTTVNNVSSIDERSYPHVRVMLQPKTRGRSACAFVATVEVRGIPTMNHGSELKLYRDEYSVPARGLLGFTVRFIVNTPLFDDCQ